MNLRTDAFTAVHSPQDLTGELAAGMGFREVARLKEGLLALSARPDVSAVLTTRLGDVLRELASAPDPDQAFAGLQRFLEAGGAASDALLEWHEPEFLRVMATLLAGTPALSEYLIRFPVRATPIIEPVILKQVLGGPAWRNLLRQN